MGCTFTVVADQGDADVTWLTVTSGAGPTVGDGAGQVVTYRAAATAHNAAARSGAITVLDERGTATTAILTVTQIADPAHVCP